MESKNMIHVWLIKHSTTDGVNYLDCAYTNEHSCRMICSDFKIGRTGEYFTENDVLGEPISDNRVIVDNRVYHLSNITPNMILCKRAVKKLSKEECEALIKLSKEELEILIRITKEHEAI